MTHLVPKDLVISVGSASTNLTCYGFHVWAEDFLNAAKAYAPNARQGSFIGHLLCCQSIELSLKALLSLRGVTRKELKKAYGHNLDKLGAEAVCRNIAEFVTLTTADMAVIRDANAWYDTPAGKRLQYFDLGDALGAFRGSPEYSALEGLADRLQSPAFRHAVLNA